MVTVLFLPLQGNFKPNFEGHTQFDGYERETKTKFLISELSFHLKKKKKKMKANAFSADKSFNIKLKLNSMKRKKK